MTFKKLKKGDIIGKKTVLETRDLSNGWQISKWTGTKGKKDFIVKLRSPDHPIGFAVKHAHFAIDFYGKRCQDKDKANLVLNAIYELWNGGICDALLQKYQTQLALLGGYSLEYYLKSLDWILEQEDINYQGRPPKKQRELDQKLNSSGFSKASNREGSQLAMALFCDIAQGIHPVEAFYFAGLRI